MQGVTEGGPLEGVDRVGLPLSPGGRKDKL